MAIYKMARDKKEFVEVEPTSFGNEGVLERADLQRILRDQPEVLEKGLLIISEEFGNWEDSNRRIDLLGLDAGGRLVVVELKRGETGQHMDLQAIRYAAMVANMTLQQAVYTFQDYLEERAKEPGEEPVEEGEAESRIREHLGIAELDNRAIQTEMPRIILASENFSKELTTCVMWLNDSWLRDTGHEIKCIRLQPHRNGDEVLVESSVVVPLPEASDYQIRVGQREREKRLDEPRRLTAVQHVHGSEPFDNSISRAEERFQPVLRQLHDFAGKLQESELVQFSTYVNGKGDYVRLELRVPGKGFFLVSFNILLSQGGAGGISFWPEWGNNAPISFIRIGELIGPVKSNSGIRHRMLSRLKPSDLPDIFATIHDAYREANGLPITGECSAAFSSAEN